jgi:peptidyl-prolyl cis-trans isomerase SurA
LRHITYSVSEEEVKYEKEKITLIRNKIIDKKISFADAARTESDQKRRELMVVF